MDTRLVFEYSTPNSHAVRVYKMLDDKESYSVTYGLQLHVELSYSESAHELGKCIMHALQCEGDLN